MLATLALLVGAHASDPCDALNARIRRVYDFRPSKVTEKGREAKAKEMDGVWDLVKKDRDRLVPCLRAALEDPKADRWFRIDGSALLVEVDPSRASREAKLRHWLDGDWADLAPEAWMFAMAELGAAGLDVTAAGERWLDGPETFHLARHALEVGPKHGATFLFGSIEESLATPVLARLAADPKQPRRELALDLLASQATPEALRALKALDLSTFPEKYRLAVQPLLAEPRLVRAMEASSMVTRDRLLNGFRAFLKGDPDPLDATKYADGEVEEHWAERVTGVLKDEDLPLLRQVRRLRMTYASDEALYDYDVLTRILMARVWKPELVR